MARIAMDTRAQNSWKELIEKEAATRIACKLKQEETDAETAKDDDKWFIRSKYTGTKPITNKSLNAIQFPPKPVIHNQSKEIEELTKKLKENQTNLLSDMRKPKQEVTKLLYDGFTKEQKGRYQYLRARKSDNPEEKYEYPLVSSFEYGWKLKEVAPEYKTPQHGRGRIVESSFYRRNGVF